MNCFVQNDEALNPKTRCRAAAVFMLLFFLFAFSTAFGQHEKETISVSEFISLLLTDEEVIEVSNVQVVFEAGDEALAENKIFYKVFNISPTYRGSQKLYLYDCEFNTGTEAPLVFTGWDLKRLNMTGCTVNTDLVFENCRQSGSYPLLFENNLFGGKLEFNGDLSLENIAFNDCRFNHQLLFETGVSQIAVQNSRFIADTLAFGSNAGQTRWQFSLSGQQAEEVTITSCRFTNDRMPNVYSVNLANAVLDKLVLLHTGLGTLDFSNTKVEKAILIDSLLVRDFVGVQNFDFPEHNTNIPWYNLGGEKLALLEETVSGTIQPYQARTKSQLLNTLNYNDLVSAYNKLNKIYHDRGDIQSANRSYVEIKTLETRRQKQLLKHNWDLNIYINYQLNVFLSRFSDYATNPGKSLLWSLFLILIFTVLYMFSFSRWDGMNYAFYVARFNSFSAYIRGASLEEAFPRQANPIEVDVHDLRENYLLPGNKTPRLLRLFGTPLYYLGALRYNLIPGLIRFFRFRHRPWKDLKGSRKLMTGMLIFLISIIYIFYILIVKFFNSLILSLNNFVVIGFGALPEEKNRFAMYLSIIEGIIGWFLLTIFTITLLSQVLQNA